MQLSHNMQASLFINIVVIYPSYSLTQLKLTMLYNLNLDIICVIYNLNLDRFSFPKTRFTLRIFGVIELLN